MSIAEKCTKTSSVPSSAAMNPCALQHLRELADHHFNKSVAAARARQWGTAAEHLVVALVLNPADDEARGLLHKVRLQQRSPSQGRVTARARVRPGCAGADSVKGRIRGERAGACDDRICVIPGRAAVKIWFRQGPASTWERGSASQVLTLTDCEPSDIYAGVAPVV